MACICNKHTLSAAGSKQQTIAAHCETRFGSKQLVLRSLRKAKEALCRMCASPDFEDCCKLANGKAATEMRDDIMSFGEGTFWELAEVLEALMSPIMDAVHKLEADLPLLSRVLSMINEIERHAEYFELTQAHLCKDMSVVVDRRLRHRYYKPCHAAAFMLDPVNFEQQDDGSFTKG
ncbi:MAG: hypothetical protein HC767_11850 [Akkermansiaceae bacterium]|nr:hypothetical protein [Akkermansiaceae bacterium]